MRRIKLNDFVKLTVNCITEKEESYKTRTRLFNEEKVFRVTSQLGPIRCISARKLVEKSFKV